MPESSREIETELEAVVEARRQTQQENRASRNVVTVLSQLANDNLSLVRNISTGLAVAGVIVIARSIRLVTKFRSVHEIPARFIERHVSLCGKVRSITEEGIQVEHVPIYLPIFSPLLSKHKDVCTSLLLVHLAGVELTSEGKLWLQKNLTPAQTVWLKLISREDNALNCLLSQSKVRTSNTMSKWFLSAHLSFSSPSLLSCLQQRSVWSVSINEELLRLGLARTAPIAGVTPDSRLYWRLHRRLHRAEVKAEKRGRGLWKEDSVWERASKALRDNSFIRLMRRIFRRTE